MEELTTQSVQTLNETLQKGQHILFFTADWCGDCRFIKPAMPAIEAEFADWHFINVDRDAFIELCQDYDIFGIPSFVAIRNGKEVGRFVNKDRKTQAEIEKFINQLPVTN